VSRHSSTGEQDSIGGLVADIVQDGQKLIRQEILLARTELQHEWEKAKRASAAFAAGATLAGVGGVLFLLALVHLLNAVTGLALWACYGIFALIVGGAGGYLILRGKTAAKDVVLVPRQTVDSVKESAKWFKNQTLSERR
jgi:hypothetical protein